MNTSISARVPEGVALIISPRILPVLPLVLATSAGGGS
jgi:hypothetical protein